LIAIKLVQEEAFVDKLLWYRAVPLFILNEIFKFGMKEIFSIALCLLFIKLQNLASFTPFPNTTGNFLY
jgi:hypothetical protein